MTDKSIAEVHSLRRNVCLASIVAVWREGGLLVRLALHSPDMQSVAPHIEGSIDTTRLATRATLLKG